MKTLWESATIFLQKNGYNVSEDEFRTKMLAHPDYPSLYSLSDILDKMLIKHRVFKLDEKNSALLEFPVMAHVKYKGKQSFETILSKRSLSKKKSMIFQNHQGYFLLLDRTMPIAKINISKSIKKVYLGGLSLILILALFYDFNYLANTFSYLVFLINLLGISISFFLLSSELGGQMLKKICFIKGGRCIDSDRQDLGYISFADLAAMFFYSNTLFFIFYKFVNHLDDALLVYSYISYLTIPVILISIVVQFLQKRWCVFCIAIDILLALNVIISIKNIYHTTTLSGIEPAFAFYIFLIILSASWLFIKPYIKKKRLFDKKQVEFIKFLTRKDIFQAALNQSDYLVIDFWKDEISLGAQSSMFKFLLILKSNSAEGNNFFEMFKNLAQIFPGKLFVAIRFNGDYSDAQSTETELREKIVEINQAEPDNTYALTLRHIEWCQENKINISPVIYLTGYKIPEIYNSDNLQGVCYDLLSADLP